MKKFLLIITIIASFTAVSFSQDNSSQDSSSMMQKCPMMGAAMAMMMPKVVASMPDGSIYVLSGHQLLKYDKDLQLQRQTTIPKDTASMEQMRKMCPMKNQNTPQ